MDKYDIISLVNLVIHRLSNYVGDNFYYCSKVNKYHEYTLNLNNGSIIVNTHNDKYVKLADALALITKKYTKPDYLTYISNKYLTQQDVNNILINKGYVLNNSHYKLTPNIYEAMLPKYKLSMSPPTPNIITSAYVTKSDIDKIKASTKDEINEYINNKLAMYYTKQYINTHVHSNRIHLVNALYYKIKAIISAKPMNIKADTCIINTKSISPTLYTNAYINRLTYTDGPTIDTLHVVSPNITVDGLPYMSTKYTSPDRYTRNELTDKCQAIKDKSVSIDILKKMIYDITITYKK